MKSKIVLVSPAAKEANNGNWHTASRWAKFLSGDCDTAIQPSWSQGDSPADLLIALHARRSAPSVHAWATQNPGKPIIVVLTGTDLYRDIQTDVSAQQTLKLATYLVVLQDAGLVALPAELRAKTRVIYQSAQRLVPAVKTSTRFTALMVGHLRDEKDPLTFINAAKLCSEKAIHFEQIGGSLDARLGDAASQATAHQRNYRWLGELPRSETRQRIKRAHVLVNCSVMEGGAHVILEAVQSGTAVLASRIDGNIGMLGADYAGYFDLGDAAALTALVQRCKTQPAFLSDLERQCAQRAALFQPAAEKRLVLHLTKEALSQLASRH